MINVKEWLRLFGDRLEVKYMILLVLACLHYEKKITDAKLKGQLQALRKGTLQKRRRLYHCEINDQWYNDHEPVLNIFTEVADDKNIGSISYQELIKYIDLLENRGYNHAINVFGDQYLYPIFYGWDPEYTNSFSNYLGFFISNVEAKIYKHSCYECGHERISVDKRINENTEIIDKWLHQQKKGNLSKIPFHNIGKFHWY